MEARDERDIIVAQLYQKEGWPLERIGNNIGCSKQTVANILEEMGIDRGYNYDQRKADHDTKLDIITKLQNWKEQHGRAPRFSEWNWEPTAQTIRKRFGSWEQALEDAGLEKPPHKNQKFSDDELLEEIMRVFKEEGKVTVNIMEERDDCPHPMTIIKRFGSFNEAKEQAGINDIDPKDGSNVEYTKDDLIIAMRTALRKNGNQYITIKEWDEKHAPPSSSTIRSRFRSWRTAINFARRMNDET